jgi:succinoglycan biosynthesis transport protein ExoP
MESSNKKRNSGYGPGNSNRPYGYGSYGYNAAYAYGYGYSGAGGEGTAIQRSFRDYVLIIRERAWYIAATFAIVFGAAIAYTATRVPIYQSTATVEIFRRAPTVMQVQQVLDNQVNTAEDLNTQINILKSSTIIQGVADNLTGTDLDDFLAPYLRPGQPKPSVVSILENNREIIPERLSLVLSINYRHPNPEVAAKVANLFADAYSNYNAKIRVDESMKAVEELEQRANSQRKKVDEIAAAIQAYREKNKLVSLDQRTDIDTETLKELNSLVTKTSAILQDAEIKLKQVKLAQANGRTLLELPFIASVPAVSQLQGQVAAQKIAVAQLSERYRDKYPLMISARRTLTQAEAELKQAIDTSAAQVDADYQTALQNNTRAQEARVAQEKQSLNLDRYGLEYSNLQRDFEVNEKILEQILDLERMRQTASAGTLENQNARILDRAIPSRRPISPSYPVNLGVGLIGGLILGLSLAFFVAQVDDRIKSAYDIEVIAGLSLIGIIPEILQLKNPDAKEALTEPEVNQEVTEAFSTLLSALQLKPESKKAQCVLVTSTIAGEGKSFISTHLAQTYGAHGERVIVVDCDLRRPAVNRVFHLENLKGTIDVCSGEASLDEVIIKNVRPNLDVLTTGGRSKNPSQVLNSKEFALMVSELRKRYDRIFIDTPPIAIVSDAMLVLPHVDGSIYSIYFNKARRNAVKISAQRLLSNNVPNFGAVLNGLSGGVGGQYYSHYYDRSYKGYYVTNAESKNGKGPKILDETPGQKTRDSARK